MFFCKRLLGKPGFHDHGHGIGFILRHYFVRIGALAEIRVATALVPLERFRRVVVRSPRGVEIAEVVSERRSRSGGESPPRAGSQDGSAGGAADASASRYRILRPTTESDELLVGRLDRYKREAMEACRERLRLASSDVVLLDIDQLLDGGTLLMHFLGDVDAVAQEIAREVAERYESVVRTNHLSELLRDGCGPGCGTTAGCGTACSGCTGCG